MQQQHQLMTVTDTAKYLGCTTQTVYNHISKGTIDARRDTSVVMVVKNDKLDVILSRKRITLTDRVSSLEQEMEKMRACWREMEKRLGKKSRS